MGFGTDMDAWEATGTHKVALQEKPNKTRCGLSAGELKLLVISGTGFFMDAYDLFIINMVVPILLLVYFPGDSKIPYGLDGGVLKAAANIGNVGGQIVFGFLGDSFGRRFVYGKELLFVIVGIIVMISVPHSLGGHAVVTWITVTRVFMGFGIGGDYPLSAAVMADRAGMKRRGPLVALVFAAQGWGGLVGAVLAVIVIACYKDTVQDGDVGSLDGAWRILIGLGLVPALLVLPLRLLLQESTQFKEARKLQDRPEYIMEAAPGDAPSFVSATDGVGNEGSSEGQKRDKGASDSSSDDGMAVALGLKAEGKSAHNDFFQYFSEWRHLKILIGTCMCWFLVDVAFYGINLNQSAILSAINWTKSDDTWRKLMETATGNLIIIAAGYFPGYYVTVFLVEVIGRRAIQLIGFAMSALFLGIAGGDYDHLTEQAAPFFIVFTLLQFFFNFGANSTTFVIPAEVYPARVRTTAFGLSAAVGKAGAILASLGFATWSDSIGKDKVLLIFMAFSLAGIPFTFLIPETKNRDAEAIDREELLEQYRGQELATVRAAAAEGGDVAHDHP